MLNFVKILPLLRWSYDLYFSICILLLFDGVFCIHLLSPSGLMCPLMPSLPSWFSVFEQTEMVPTIELIVAHCFLTNAGVWKCIFLLDLSSPGFIQKLFNDFIFLVKALFCNKYSFGTSIWFWYQTISTKAGWKCFQPSSFRKGLLQIKLCQFSAFGLFLWKGCPLEIGFKKTSAWLL